MGFTVMPSPFGDALAQIGTGLGTGISKGMGDVMQQRQQRQRTQREGTILNEILQNLPENPSLNEVMGAYSYAQSKGVSPETIKQYASQRVAEVESRAKLAQQGDQSDPFAEGILYRYFGDQEQIPGESMGKMSIPTQMPTQQQLIPVSPEMGGGLGAVKIQPSDVQKQITSPIKEKPINLTGEPQVTLDGELIPPQKIPEEEQPGMLPMHKISDNDLVALMGSSNKRIANTAAAEWKIREARKKEKQEQKKYEAERAIPHMRDIDKERASVKEQENALFLTNEALNRGDVGFFSKNNFAKHLKKYGIGFVDEAGGIMDTGVKDFLMANLQKVGNRPNQWIEQQIKSMMPEIGKNKYANMAITAAINTAIDIKKKRIELTDKISDWYMKNEGYIPGNIAGIVDRQLQPQIEDMQNKFKYEVQKIEEKKKINNTRGYFPVNKKVEKGTFLTPEGATYFHKEFKGDIDKATERIEKLGYKIPTKQQLRRWEK